MALVLQVLGALTLLFFLFIVVVVLVIRAKLRKFVRNLEGMSQSLLASVTPARIHLQSMAVPSWEDAEAVAAQSEELPGLGFVKGGSYQVEEVPGMALEAWFHPERAVTAVIYEHPKAGVWTDMATRYQDGTRATFANTQQGEGVDHAPGHIMERFPGLTARALYERFLAERPDRPAITPTAELFVEVFEKAYADEMDWRNSRGGPTEDEIRRVAELTGEPISEEVLAATREMERSRAAAQLDEAVRERFLAETALSAAAWEKVRERIVVVHDRMTQELFESALMQCNDDRDWDDDPAPRIDETPEHSPRRLFAAINARAGDGRRCEKLGEVGQPVVADLYVVPETE